MVFPTHGYRGVTLLVACLAMPYLGNALFRRRPFLATPYLGDALCSHSVDFLSVPSRIRALTKSRSKSTPGVKVNERRRLGKETPRGSVAKARRHLCEGVAQPGRRQDQISLRQGNHRAVPRYPWAGKTMERATPWEGLGSR